MNSLEEIFAIEDIREIKSNNDSNIISCDDYPFTLELRRSDIDDEKEFVKFVKCVENMVRHSDEYKLWNSYIKDALGHKNCCITKEVSEEVSVELHHHPFTLFLICKSVIKRYIASGEKFCSFDIAQKVIELHYSMKVSFCLLIKSLHEKYHNNIGFSIPMELVKGDYKTFMNEYGSFMEDTDLEIIQSKLNINLSTCGWELQWIKPKEIN